MWSNDGSGIKMIDFACKKFDLNEVIRCSLGFTKTEFAIMRYFVSNPGKEFTAKEISIIFNIGFSTSQKAINRINKSGLMKRSQRNLGKGGYVFVYSIKDKLVLEKKILGIIHNWMKNVEAGLKKW